jgi:hypothetical protein
VRPWSRPVPRSLRAVKCQGAAKGAPVSAAGRTYSVEGMPLHVAFWRNRGTPPCYVDTEHDNEGARLSRAMAKTGSAAGRGHSCAAPHRRNGARPRSSPGTQVIRREPKTEERVAFPPKRDCCCRARPWKTQSGAASGFGAMCTVSTALRSCLISSSAIRSRPRTRSGASPYSCSTCGTRLDACEG